MHAIVNILDGGTLTGDACIVVSLTQGPTKYGSTNLSARELRERKQACGRQTLKAFVAASAAAINVEYDASASNYTKPSVEPIWQGLVTIGRGR